NGFVLEFLSHYEESHKNPPSGKSFRDIYNVDTLEPTEEWLEKYNLVSDAIIKSGLDVHNRWKEVKQKAA
ncbi:MAG: monomethylamine:corrinoid methyltransferase, partial [Anaerolineales bacterium]|nr:monomethylamine:corrinoid methyltransferase [Anaerolineales bacterium]